MKTRLQGPLGWQIAWRYLRGERSQMLSSTALAALVATTLGVMAMVLAMALMTGYTADLERKLVGLQGEIVLSPLTPDAFAVQAEALDAVAALDGVERLGRVSYGEGSLSSSAVGEGLGIVLRGVDRDAGDSALAQLTSDVDFSLLFDDDEKLPGILVGRELLRQLEAEPGDKGRLVVLVLGQGDRPRFRYRSVRLAGSFSTGFSEFDTRWVLIDREILEGIRGDVGLDVVEVELVDPARTEAIAETIEGILGADWIVQRWHTLNRDLFAALALQETMLFLVLGLIVVVSTFNVASALVILVRERLRDVGVLAALGLAPRRLWGIFVLYGLALGAVGTALGVALGAGISWVITTYELVRFDPEVAAIYFIDSVPFRVDLVDVAAIVAFSFAVTLAACALPALRAARVRPSDALRAE